MIEIDALLMISFVCVLGCIFFTMGRFVEKSEDRNNDKTSDKKATIDYYQDGVCDDIIEGEYEEVYTDGVIDFQSFKKNKDETREKEIENVTGYEWMYSKRDDRYVKVPRDIADFIRYLKDNMNDEVDKG